eukprot:gene3915-4169_t
MLDQDLSGLGANQLASMLMSGRLTPNLQPPHPLLQPSWLMQGSPARYGNISSFGDGVGPAAAAAAYGSSDELRGGAAAASSIAAGGDPGDAQGMVEIDPVLLLYLQGSLHVRKRQRAAATARRLKDSGAQWGQDFVDYAELQQQQQMAGQQRPDGQASEDEDEQVKGMLGALIRGGAVRHHPAAVLPGHPKWHELKQHAAANGHVGPADAAAVVCKHEDAAAAAAAGVRPLAVLLLGRVPLMHQGSYVVLGGGADSPSPLVQGFMAGADAAAHHLPQAALAGGPLYPWSILTAEYAALFRTSTPEVADVLQLGAGAAGGASQPPQPLHHHHHQQQQQHAEDVSALSHSAGPVAGADALDLLLKAAEATG